MCGGESVGQISLTFCCSAFQINKNRQIQTERTHQLDDNFNENLAEWGNELYHSHVTYEDSGNTSMINHFSRISQGNYHQGLPPYSISLLNAPFMDDI